MPGDGERAPDDRDRPIRIGVSACLVGAEVRFDGQHKRDAFLADELGRLVEWVTVCPEVEVGMGVPREPVRLVRPGGGGGGGGARMIGLQSGADWTARMNALAARRVRELAAAGDLSGYVLKSRSPSCGMERVNLYPASAAAGANPMPSKQGVGLFAAELMRQLPNLPVEEEGRLTDARLRESFVERVFAYHRVRALWRRRWTVGDLVAFHTAHKMALLAHSAEGYRRLGRLVAAAKGRPRAELRADYEAAFMAALKRPTTPGRHANVLEHMAGYLRGRLDDGDRRELAGVIEDHRKGLMPLVVPVVLLRHHVRRHRIAYLAGQTYLDAHPKELMLRNRI